MITEHQVSERQACKALNVARSSYQYRPKAKHDTPVINELQVLVNRHPAIGFWQSYFTKRPSKLSDRTKDFASYKSNIKEGNEVSIHS